MVLSIKAAVIEVVFGHLFRLSSAKSMDVEEGIFVYKDLSINATWAWWDYKA